MRKFLPLIVVSCVTLAPAQQRSIEEIIPTTVSKQEAYDRALVYLAKRLANSNMAVQIKDPGAGRIVSNARVSCSPISALSTLYGEATDFHIDITTKDNKVRIIFDDIQYFARDQYGTMHLHGPSDSGEAREAFTKCLRPIRDELVAAIKGEGPNRSNDF